ncbi:MAG: 5-formyltetrahydrofolate cyclo-ligase [Lachnospiraceae bacterium]|nr:5-formyltetrahydrofolate cyclo-ligase [Lachnospiraceae bacterium]
MGEDAPLTKKELRHAMLKKRREMTDEECALASKMICGTFLACDEYKKASSILLYKAYDNEADTDLIFERALADGKTVAYPAARTDCGYELIFYKVSSLSQLHPGFKGIMEPDAGSSDGLFSGTADVCITPGAVFDRSCHRIGYGMAFYDRFLRSLRPRSVIGLAYDFQVVRGFEAEETDESVDMVITESGIYTAHE